MLQWIYGVIAVVGLLAALGTVLSRNLVHAALFLVAFFFTIACQFVILEAEFLAALQVLVYIGAVAIILMFGIMLTRNIQGDDTTTLPAAWKAPGLIAGLCVFAVLAFGINNAVGPGGGGPWSEADARPSITPTARESAFNASRREAVNNMGRAVGNELMTRYVVAFEMAGLLLTAALVGAIALAFRDEEHVDAVRGGGETARDVAPAGSPGSGRDLASAAERQALVPRS